MITWWSIVAGAARWHFFSQLIYPSSAGMVQAAALCVQRCPVFMVAKWIVCMKASCFLHVVRLIVLPPSANPAHIQCSPHSPSGIM